MLHIWRGGLKGPLGKGLLQPLRRAWKTDNAQPTKWVYFKTNHGVIASHFRFSRPEKIVKKGEAPPLIPVQEIGDNTSTSDCLHLIRKQKQFVLFKGNTQNLNQLFSSIKKTIKTRRDPSKLKTDTLSTLFKVSLNRKLEESNLLNRILLSFRLDSPQTCLSLASYKPVPLITQQFEGIASTTTFPSFGEDGEVIGFACGLNHYMGMRGASEWERKGIAVRALGDKKVFPFYSVFSPTQQRYVQLLDEYMVRHGSLLKSGSVVLDAGAGTGVLGLLLASHAQKQSKNIRVICSDLNPTAIECIRHNAKQILGGNADSIKAVYCDVYPPRNDKGNNEKNTTNESDVDERGKLAFSQTEDVGMGNIVEALPQIVEDGEGLGNEEGKSEDEDLLNAPLQEGNIHTTPKKKKKMKLLKSKGKLKSKSKSKGKESQAGQKESTEPEKMDYKYDLIVSNPPYLIIEDETLRNLDMGSYDVNGAFIKKLLSELNDHLADNGKLLLIYSDLGVNLGLQAPDLIENLCDLHHLTIEEITKSSTNPPEIPVTLPEKVDYFKKHSNYLLLVIKKKQKPIQ